jgi:hypothetical protein
MVTNGLEHYCCAIDIAGVQWTYLREIPSFAEMMLRK